MSARTANWDGKFLVKMAQAMERACFDYILSQDTLMVPEAYCGSYAATLKYALQVPKHDPMPLTAMTTPRHRSSASSLPCPR